MAPFVWETERKYHRLLLTGDPRIYIGILSCHITTYSWGKIEQRFKKKKKDPPPKKNQKQNNNNNKNNFKKKI